MGAFADSRQLRRGCNALPVRSLFINLISLFGGKKRPVRTGIVAEPVSKSPCGQRMTAAFRREIARKPGRRVSRQFRG
jgi:hypothetical protein